MKALCAAFCAVACRLLVGLTLVAGQGASGQGRPSFAAEPDLPAASVVSAFEYLTEDSKALQNDDFANPGFLWVERGEQLFKSPAPNAPGCSGCHQPDELVGAAARYPSMDAASGELINLEGRINACRERHQQLPQLEYESEELLSLTAYVARLSRGMPYDVKITGSAAPYFDEGRNYFFSRRGQLNLACHQCHDRNWGKMLRGDRLSQGHGNAFPGYRLEWQSLGSLHRRFRDCDAGVRAEPQALGAAIYTSLELYLAWRARRLPMEAPGVRR